ncbi:MAG: Na+/H+ antiporter NhaA [Deltaproteobacteria bacterium]|nr:MAG: Na+/H+ antiporter NhaA [Deltaproteobacteria bacterium]
MAHPSGPAPFPRRPIDRLLDPLRRFLHVEAASGILLLVVTAVALVLANTPLAEHYFSFIEQRVVVGVGEAVLDYPLWYWVNDGLMTLFFFVVGLEIKRELISGELADKKKAMLPVVAAIGGAILPAAIFTGVIGGGPGADGWGIPMATDIAFVVGAMALLGDRVPHGLKVFVLSAAIADDLLAVLVIAVFYSHGLAVGWLLAAAVGFVAVWFMKKSGVRSIGAYVLVGAAIWLFTLKSGIHPTIAGVILGLMTPAAAWLGREAADVVAKGADALSTPDELSNPGSALVHANLAAREARSPLERIETALHPWVAFLVMPIFAFVNAGVPLAGAAEDSIVPLAIVLGLLVGKPIGLVLFAYLAVRFAGALLPARVSWPMLAATGLLAGVGFTMSLFIASLGLEGPLLTSAKMGILAGSGIALALGLVALLLTTRGRKAADAEA